VEIVAENKEQEDKKKKEKRSCTGLSGWAGVCQ